MVVFAGVWVCIKAVRGDNLPDNEEPEVPSKIFGPTGFVLTPAEKKIQAEWDELIEAGTVRRPGSAH